MRGVLLAAILLLLPLAQAEEPVISPAAREGLIELLAAPGGAYESYAFYIKALSVLGPKEPFRHFLDGERYKRDRVIELLRKYGVSFPQKNPYLGRVELPTRAEAAARLALSLETKSVYLERRLGRVFADYAELKNFVKTLEAADDKQREILRMAIAQGGTLGDDVVRGLAHELGELCPFVFGPGICP